MNICVVGAGPTAEGKGDLIDACDFVVRLKSWWRESAENAGVACHAIADYGYPPDRRRWPDTEFWLTHTPRQIIGEKGLNYLETLIERHQFGVMRWVSQKDVGAIHRAMGYYPSTGLIAIAIAMRCFTPEVLTLVGFDQLTPDDPNYDCARRPVVERPDVTRPSHDFVAEKRAIAEIVHGRWLGTACATELRWIEKPNVPST